jgi:hypothetical protein
LLTGLAEPNHIGVNPRTALTATPNPFSRVTSLRLSHPFATPAALSIHDASGRLVRALRAGSASSDVTWDRKDAVGRTVEPGVYFCSVRVGGSSLETKLIVTP